MADFHFIRPLWFFALIALFFALYLLKQMRVSQSGWQGLLPKHLAKVLIKSSPENKPLSLITPFIIGLLAIIAMAGPSWQKLPQPVYQMARGSVLIMDMSYSMYSTDLSPNRLTRARYKAIDLLDNINEGEMGLIAYAGDAFIISPLTEDTNNIKLLLPSLSPDLMPELGSNPMRALILADEMLKNAGHIEGDIYWFTDGIENSEVQDITQWSREHVYKVNILGVGTKNGAPIKLTNGEFMKDNTGAIVVPKLRENPLKGLAKRGNGQYVTLQNNSDDIKRLLLNNANVADNKGQKKESANTGDQWEEMGPYIILIILPLVLMYFRRGRLLAILPVALFLTPSDQAYANIWDNLWKTDNQQAQNKFDKKQYQEAAEQFNDPLWQGSAQYKAGNFEEALKSFQQSDSAQALYNQGNALAKLNKLDEALNSYNKALEKQPNFEKAKANKALIEKLKEQQEQKQKDQKGDGESENNNESEDQQNGDQKQSDQQNENNQNDENGENGENSDQQQSDEQNSQPQDSDSQAQDNKQEGEQNNAKSDHNENEEQNEANEQSDENKNPEDTEDTEQSLAEQTNEDGSEQTQEQKAQAVRAAEKLAQETEQKHQQILNKVTDDPYQLLRNKMQLEYKKRRQNRSGLGATKKW